MSFTPKLSTFPEAQRAIWNELRQVPRSFVLYGGNGAGVGSVTGNQKILIFLPMRLCSLRNCCIRSHCSKKPQFGKMRQIR